MILLRIVRFFGVFLSPKAFLKSFITLLKVYDVVAVEDIEPEKDPWALMNTEAPAAESYDSPSILSESPLTPSVPTRFEGRRLWSNV